MNDQRRHGLLALAGETVVVRSKSGRFYTFGKLLDVHESGDPDDPMYGTLSDRDTITITLVSGQQVRYVAHGVEVAKVGEFV